MSTLHKRTRQRPRLEVVSAQPLPEDPVPEPCCAAAAQIEGALLHLQIALRTYSSGLPVDWSHVSVRMGQTLLEVDAEEDRP